MFDYKEIQKDFNKVITYSQHIENPKTDSLFKEWALAKQSIINKFGGKLIWEWPEKVSFELSEKDKKSRIEEFIDRVVNYYNNNDLADFIQEQFEGFYKNIVVKDYVAPSGDIIPKGMKLLKAFKFFESGKRILNDLQSDASRIIQENKIEGYICFSVHPLDFLSSSENKHNWRSCHSLDGEYKSGNLSYMVDSSTFICYLRSDDKVVLPNFPEDVKWNNKKWRVLLFISNTNDMMFAGRQYPFTSNNGLNFITERMLPAANFGEWSNWSNKKIHNMKTGDANFVFYSPYVPYGNRLYKMNELVINVTGSLQFNDLLSSSCYDPYYCYKVYKNSWLSDETILCAGSSGECKFYIGRPVKCLRCGEHNIELSETMMCNDCELTYGNCESDTFGYCECCGARYIVDEGVWLEHYGHSICPDCAKEYVARCEICGDIYYKEDLIYDRDRCIYTCKWCEEE